MFDSSIAFEARKEQITKELVEAAEGAGFFTLVDHGISVDEINRQFAISEAFFKLPQEVKAQIPHDLYTNNGWEYKVSNPQATWHRMILRWHQSQIRPSTGQADQKESFWLQRNSQWPSDELVPGFHDATKSFISKCEQISKQVRKCPVFAMNRSVLTCPLIASRMPLASSRFPRGSPKQRHGC